MYYIECKRSPKTRRAEFYLISETEHRYLFSQINYRTVSERFSRRVPLEKALDFSRTHRNHAMCLTIKRIAGSIGFIEDYHDISIFGRNAKENCRKYAA